MSVSTTKHRKGSQGSRSTPRPSTRKAGSSKTAPSTQEDYDLSTTNEILIQLSTDLEKIREYRRNGDDAAFIDSIKTVRGAFQKVICDVAINRYGGSDEGFSTYIFSCSQIPGFKDKLKTEYGTSDSTLSRWSRGLATPTAAAKSAIIQSTRQFLESVMARS